MKNFAPQKSLTSSAPIANLRSFITLILVFVCILSLSAKSPGKRIESVPFEMVGSYVVIKLKVNESTPLNVILDSGISNTIITELDPTDKISLNFSDVKDLMGLGGGEHLEAYKSNYNVLKVGKLKLESKTVFVLREDIFNLSKHTGTKINGLIGVDFFSDYIVEVNYSDRRVNFYENKSLTVPKGYETIPLNVESRKMFVNLMVLQSDSTQRKVKMLLDTGAELNAWFQTHKSESVHLPKINVRCTIGEGFNGEIKGVVGRMKQICFGSFCLSNPIVSFPDSASIAEIVVNSDRDGTIGSQILSRFNYFIDYGQKQFHFKPNSNFKDKYKYNIAGIEVTQIIPSVPQSEIWKVWDNSPAAAAGLKIGDQIIEIDGQRAFQFSVNELKMFFETPLKRPLEVVVMRDGKEIRVKIDMNSKI